MLDQAFIEAIQESLPDIVVMDDTVRRRIATRLSTWLAIEAKKANVDNLPQRIEKWTLRIERLAENMEIEFLGEDLVVMVSGEDEATLRSLRRGTDWFEPWPQVDDKIIETISLSWKT